MKLNVAFPSKKFDNYLRKIAVTPENFLCYDNIERLFFLITTDFKYGKVSLDELSSMLGYLWGKLDKKLMHSSELGDVLEAASERNCYVRVVEDQECADTFIFFLRKVRGYYETHSNQSR